VVGGVVVALVALPGLVGAVPARNRPVGAGELLRRVLASDRVAYQGYAEARAGLGLPDVPRAGWWRCSESGPGCGRSWPGRTGGGWTS